MNSFKQHFYQLLGESPDKTRAGIKYSNWEQQDARTFIVSSDFYCLTSSTGIEHAILLATLPDIVRKYGYVLKKEINIRGSMFGGNFTPIKDIIDLEVDDLANRSNLLRFSQSHGLGILVGRIWLVNKAVSVWNNINDVTVESINHLIDLAESKFGIDTSTFMWEVFEKQGTGQPKEKAYTLEELEDRLGVNDGEQSDYDGHSETRPSNPQWNQLHLTPPEKKGQVMKDMGIRPKEPMGAEARFMRGESFKQTFRQLVEARSELVDKIRDAMNKVEDRPFGELFGNKDRFLIKVWNPQFEKSAKALGLDVSKFDFTKRTYAGENINKFLKELGQDYITKEKKQWKDPELNKLLDSLFGDVDSQQILDKPVLKRDEYKWTRNQNPELDIIGKIKQAIDQNNVYYYLLFSRHPIDVLRMSDHKGISSCHRLKGAYNTTAGEYADCAIADASNDGGIVYLIRGGDARRIKDKLDEPDVFEDRDRSVDGIRPLGRIRLRRFVDLKTGKDWAVPTKLDDEQKYGTFTQELYSVVLQYCQTHQQIFNNPPDQEYAEENVVLVGGNYSDESLAELLNNFFDEELYYYGSIKHKSGHHTGWQEELNNIINQTKRLKYHKILKAKINPDRTVQFSFSVNAPVLFVGNEDEKNIELHFNRLQKEWNYIYSYKAEGRDREIIKQELQIIKKGELAWTVGEYEFVLNDPEEVREYVQTFIRDETEIDQYFGELI